MSSIDEFQNDLRRTLPRPLSPSVIEAVEARLQESRSQQPAAVPRARPSRVLLVGVWSSGFAIGAAAMLLVSFRVGNPSEPLAPSVTRTLPQVHEKRPSIAAVEDVAPVETLVSYPAWTPREHFRRRASEILTAGSDPSMIFDLPPTPAGVSSFPDHAIEFVPEKTLPGDVTPDRYRSPAPAMRRELIDQILNEV